MSWASSRTLFGSVEQVEAGSDDALGVRAVVAVDVVDVSGLPEAGDTEVMGRPAAVLCRRSSLMADKGVVVIGEAEILWGYDSGPAPRRRLPG